MSEEPLDVYAGLEPVTEEQEDDEAKNDVKPLAELDAPSIADIEGEAWQLFEARRDGNAKPLEIPKDCGGDLVSPGLWPGMHVIVGNTGTGKSQWALQVALHACKEQGHPVLYLALELGKVDVYARLLSLAYKSPFRWSELWKGKKDALIQGNHARDMIHDLPFHIHTGKAYGFDYTQIVMLAEAMINKYNRPPVIVLDFLQLVASPIGAREDLRQRIQQAAYRARTAARDHGAWVFLVSSTARQNYDSLSEGGSVTDDPATKLIGLGKESGEIEYAADTVFVLAKKEPGVIGLGLAKQRSGKAGGWETLEFNGQEFSTLKSRFDKAI